MNAKIRAKSSSVYTFCSYYFGTFLKPDDVIKKYSKKNISYNQNRLNDNNLEKKMFDDLEEYNEIDSTWKYVEDYDNYLNSKENSPNLMKNIIC